MFIDYWALGTRYTITDDGEGKLVGQGGGAVSYTTGSINVTLKAVPDIGSSICLAHAARVAYTDRSSQGAAVRPPEYCWMIEAENPDTRVIPGSLSIGYTSGGTVRTVTDNGAGQLAGAATGVIDYFSRTVLLRPTFMPDPGAQFQVDCQLDVLAVEILSGAPDAAGFVTLSLAQQPAAGTLSVQWATARETSNTSGGQLSVAATAKSADGAVNTTVTPAARTVPDWYVTGNGLWGSASQPSWPHSSV
ncbi:hypothetical protein [Acidovorax sp. MR-S7]|uniref:hypothetical protein n=1 Tax=Acidovorax sp. MR-S7 TaxID=1268622 RepID=UPI00035DBBB1|nr:hypothetical protein [Acidovorax sp. MR-S7]GAD22353.1 hypothetical protein AVS7_02113 [Acidovorax sp. MR-S7]